MATVTSKKRSTPPSCLFFFLPYLFFFLTPLFLGVGEDDNRRHDDVIHFFDDQDYDSWAQSRGARNRGRMRERTIGTSSRHTQREKAKTSLPMSPPPPPSPSPVEQDYIGLSDRNLHETELRLGLPGSESPDRNPLPVGPSSGSKRDQQQHPSSASSAPASKAQVVGWPPVRKFRRDKVATTNQNQNQPAEKNKKKMKEEEDVGGGGGGGEIGSLYVKVSMDGAPYLRKVDLKMYKNYKDLSAVLDTMFSCFTAGQCGSHDVQERDGLNLRESRLRDLLNGSEYVLTYEDKDGDWMLVGDVPWEMFTNSCKRLRIMKSSDAIGLAPRVMEKSKNPN